MKKIMKYMTVLMLALMAQTGLANLNPVELKIGSNSNLLVLETLKNTTGTHVSLLDAHDKIIHQDKIEAGMLQKKFNLKNLATGLYYLKVKNTDIQVTYAVSINANGIQNVSKNSIASQPVLRVSENKVIVNLLNEDRGTVQVSIRNSENKEIDSQVFNDEMAIGKIYNFQGALIGDYTVIVDDGSLEYRKTISIR